MLLERRDLSTLFSLVRVAVVFAGAGFVMTAAAIALVIIL
jgi:hypothetical protein